MLKFDESDLRNISKGDHVECCEELFSLWLDGYNNNGKDNQPKNWDTLLEAMRDARMGTLADLIETSLPFSLPV